MSFATEQHRFTYTEENSQCLTHLGVEYYHMNGNGTTTNVHTGVVYTSDVVPSMYGPELHLYKDNKLVKKLVMHK